MKSAAGARCRPARCTGLQVGLEEGGAPVQGLENAAVPPSRDGIPQTLSFSWAYGSKAVDIPQLETSPLILDRIT